MSSEMPSITLDSHLHHLQELWFSSDDNPTFMIQAMSHSSPSKGWRGKKMIKGVLWICETRVIDLS